MTNGELIKEWFFNSRKPIGFTLNITGIRHSLDKIDELYRFGTFPHEAVLIMKKAYLAKLSR